MRPALLSALLLVSASTSAQWELQSAGVFTTLLGVDAVTDDVVWACGELGTVLRTTNGGATWSLTSPPSPQALITIVRAIDQQTAFVVAASPAGYVIFRTINGGTSWQPVHQNSASTCEGIHAFGPDTLAIVGGPSPFPGGFWDILRTTNGGDSWTAVGPSRCPSPRAYEIVTPWSTCSRGNSVWFTTKQVSSPTDNPRVFSSVDGGRDWTAADLTVGWDMSGYVAFADEIAGVIVTDAWVSGRGGVYRSTDGGVRWDSVGWLPGKAYSITAVPGPPPVYFAGGFAGQIGYSPDSGRTWVPSPTGRFFHLYWMDASANRIWAVGESGEILRGTIQLIVGVEEPGREVPAAFRLEQNFPNPFNPGTAIRFTLAEREPTTLTIYDLLGRAVVTLVDGTLDPGSHTVFWDAEDAATGVYICRLVSGQRVATTRMLLLR